VGGEYTNRNNFVVADHPLLSGVRNKEVTFEPFMIVVLSETTQTSDVSSVLF